LTKANLKTNGRSFFANKKEDARQWLKETVLAQSEFPIGVFCNSDEMLVEVYKELSRERLNIPEQVSLSCISDGVTPKMLRIDIPYIEHSGYDVGWEASQLLLDILQGDPTIVHSDRQVETKSRTN